MTHDPCGNHGDRYGPPRNSPAATAVFAARTEFLHHNVCRGPNAETADPVFVEEPSPFASPNDGRVLRARRAGLVLQAPRGHFVRYRSPIRHAPTLVSAAQRAGSRHFLAAAGCRAAPVRAAAGR